MYIRQTVRRRGGGRAQGYMPPFAAPGELKAGLRRFGAGQTPSTLLHALCCTLIVRSVLAADVHTIAVPKDTRPAGLHGVL